MRIIISQNFFLHKFTLSCNFSLMEENVFLGQKLRNLNIVDFCPFDLHEIFWAKSFNSIFASEDENEKDLQNLILNLLFSLKFLLENFSLFSGRKMKETLSITQASDG